MAPFAYMWEFTVAPGREAAFAALYGAEGGWVQLFRTAPGYLETLLLRSQAHPDRFITIDRWASESAYRRFRAERAAEFEAIDAQGEALTTGERLLGEFTEPD